MPPMRKLRPLTCRVSPGPRWSDFAAWSPSSAPLGVALDDHKAAVVELLGVEAEDEEGALPFDLSHPEVDVRGLQDARLAVDLVLERVREE